MEIATFANCNSLVEVSDVQATYISYPSNLTLTRASCYIGSKFYLFKLFTPSTYVIILKQLFTSVNSIVSYLAFGDETPKVEEVVERPGTEETGDRLELLQSQVATEMEHNKILQNEKTIFGGKSAF